MKNTESTIRNICNLIIVAGLILILGFAGSFDRGTMGAAKFLLLAGAWIVAILLSRYAKKTITEFPENKNAKKDPETIETPFDDFTIPDFLTDDSFYEDAITDKIETAEVQKCGSLTTRQA